MRPQAGVLRGIARGLLILISVCFAASAAEAIDVEIIRDLDFYMSLDALDGPEIPDELADESDEDWQEEAE